MLIEDVEKLNAQALSMEDKFKVLADTLNFVLTHPNKKEDFEVMTVRQSDWCNCDNPDGSEPIPVMYTTFMFNGKLGELLELALNLFEDREDPVFNLTIESEGDDGVDEDSYLNSNMNYEEFVKSLFNHFSVGRMVDLEKKFFSFL